MKRIILLILSLSILLSFEACRSQKQALVNQNPPKEQLVLISTDYGDIKIRLYSQTPKHKENFVKLISNHFYDSTLFHRVIKDFMIQGGDPDSKNAPAGQMLGNGDIGYTVPAEINDSLFHKKGALAAARQGDNVNPLKASSGCQFYIVHGRVFSTADLDGYETSTNMPVKQKLFGDFINREENKALKEKFILFQQTGKSDSLQALSGQIEPILLAEFEKLPHFKFSEEQRKAYTTIGGAPHLDKNYTVFGEVVEGLDVIDKIAMVQTAQGDRPLIDIRMKIKLIDVDNKTQKKSN
jgi:peptidylprolyl isomerase